MTSATRGSDRSNSLAHRQRVLVFISEGGGGHKSASDALSQILCGKYDVKVDNAVKCILGCIDPLHFFSRHKFSTEDIYNFLLRHNFHRTIHWGFARGCRRLLDLFQGRIEKTFHLYFERLDRLPDLVVSTVPLFNVPLIKATGRRKIPLLILPTDLESETFLSGMKEIGPQEGSHISFALPYDDPDLMLKVVLESNLASSQIEVTGFPLRPTCTEYHSMEELEAMKRRHDVRDGYRTATLVMGAAGSNRLASYAMALYDLELVPSQPPLQLNVCVGRNSRMARRLVRRLLSEGCELLEVEGGRFTLQSLSGNLIHIRGFTPHVLEIMAVSDLLITKTGSCSVNEGIYLRKHLLIDNTPGSSARKILWERYNVGFVKRHQLGDAFSTVEELQEKTRIFLSSPPPPPPPFELPPFHERIAELIDQLIEQREALFAARKLSE